MAVSMEQIRRLTIEAGTRGVSETTRDLAGLKGALDGISASADASAKTTDTNAKSVERAGAAFDGLMRRVDGTIRKSEEFARGLRVVTAAINQGAVDSDKAAAAIALLGDRYAASASKFDPMIGAAIKYRAELAELRAAHNDGVISGSKLIENEQLLKMAFERTASAIKGRAAAEKAAVERSVSAQTITPDRGADIAAYANEMNRLQAEFDGVFAAQQNYERMVDRVRFAHSRGAIDVSLMAAKEKQYRDELDRTIASLTGAGTAMARYMSARNSINLTNADILVAKQTIVPNRGADIAAYGTELDQLRAKFNPLWAAGQQYRATIDEIARAERVGAIAANEATAARARAREETSKMVRVIRGEPIFEKTGGNGLNSTQRSMLSSGAFNTIGSLGSGAPITQVMLQQGADLAQAFSMGPNGVGGTFAALRGIFVSWLPTIVGVTAALGPLIAVGYGFFRFRSEVESLGHSLDGLGRRSGETMSSLSALAARGSDAGGLSISEGRAAAAAYAGAGIGGGVNEGLIAQTKAFARVTGTDLDAASKTLATAFADPTKGAQQLGDTLGFVDQKTKESIASFQRQGDIISARRVLFDAMSKDLASAADRTQNVAKGWTAIGNAISDATGKLGEWTARQVGLSGGNPEDIGLQEIRSMIEKYGNPYSGWASSRKGRLDELRQQEREILRGRAYRSFSAADTASEMAANQQGQVVAGYISNIIPEMDKRKALADQIAAVEKAMNDPTMLARMGDAAGRVGEALGLMRDQLNGSLSAMEKIRIESDLAMQGVKARSDFERAALAASKSLGGLDPFSASPEARAKAASDYALVMAQAQREAQDRLRAANDNLGLVGLLPYQRQIAEIENRARRQNEVNAGNKDALASNSAARAAELSAAARSAISVPLANANRELEAQNRLLVVNAATFGMTTDRVVAASTAQEMFNKYLLAGVPITADLSAGVLRYAEAMGIAAKAAEDLKEKQQKAQQGMDDLRSETKGLISDLAKGKKPQDILRGMGERMIDRGAGQITDMLLGQQGKMGGGLFGDMFGGLMKDAFGVNAAAQNLAVATQNVNAGVVNIGGAPLAGLGVNGNPLAGSGSGAVGKAAGSDLSSIYSGRPGGVEGLNQDFASRLSAFAKANPGVGIVSAYRSPEHQAELWDKALAKYGSAEEARKWVAPPGSSMHNKGMAADLSFSSPEVMSRAHASAAQYGLKFPLSNENWHIEPVGARTAAGMAPLDLRTQAEMAQQTQLAATNLGNLGNTASSATGNLGQFGSGLGQLGQSLGSLIGGGKGGGGLFGFLGSLFGGLFANGGVFANGLPIPFADGGVVASPTRFAMAGGRTGIMGEAGPEAIMPLARVRGGLGVRMAGPMPGTNTTVANTSISFGGNTLVIQGNADQTTVQDIKAELDRRDDVMMAKIRKEQKAMAYPSVSSQTKNRF